MKELTQAEKREIRQIMRWFAKNPSCQGICDEFGCTFAYGTWKKSFAKHLQYWRF